MKELLVRVYKTQFGATPEVRGMLDDGLEIFEFEAVIDWCRARISDKEAMKPKEK